MPHAQQPPSMLLTAGRMARTVAVMLAGLLAVAASILIAPPAYAAPVGPDANGLSYETDPSDHTATVTDYDGTSDPAVIIPATITDGGDTYTITSIGNSAFYNNDLTTVTIPNTVTTIGDFAFYGNDLTTATIGHSVTTIGTTAFGSNDLATVSIGNSVTTIGDFAFTDNALTTVTIPNSVTTIGNQAFRRNVLTTVTIGNSVTTIGEGAFTDNALTSVTIPNTVTTIGNSAFYVNALTTVSIGNSVTTISQYAFYANPNLNSAVFQGLPPSTFTPKGPGGSLGNNPGLIVYYPSQFASDYDPGSTGLWQDYTAMLGATLNYDLGGHSTAINGITVIPGTAAPTAAAPPADPTEPGYTFEGWYTTATGTTPFDFTAPLTGDTTAFAQWATVTAAILPATGTNLAPMTGTGILALLLGGMLLAWTRRRNHSTNA